VNYVYIILHVNTFPIVVCRVCWDGGLSLQLYIEYILTSLHGFAHFTHCVHTHMLTYRSSFNSDNICHII